MKRQLPQRNQIGDRILQLYARLTSWIPEGSLKRWIRLYSLNYKFFVLDEFAINKGETYVLIGTPQPKKVLRLSKLIGPKGKLILVEPSPSNIEKHSKFISENGLNNVTLVPKAISDYQGKAKFLLAVSDSGNRLVFDDVEVDNDYNADDFYIDQIDVEVDTIDNVIEELGIEKIHFIEIAINGAEMAALRGMDKTFRITERAYVKGHCINKETGEPLHVEEMKLFRNYGFKVRKTKPSPSSAKLIDWGQRQGDVFAYR